MTAVPHPPAESRGFLVYAVVRVVALCYAIFADLSRLPHAARPGLVVVACCAMAAWTLLMIRAYSRLHRRTWAAFGPDIAVSLLLVLATPYLLGDAYADGIPVPTLWLIGAPVALAIWRSWWQGLIAAAVLSVAELAVVPDIDLRLIGVKTGMTVMTGAVGYLVRATSQAHTRSEELAATAATLAERQRLARVVHDGVLQVLAMVEREGPELGPRGVRLARAAAEQEVALRQLLQESIDDAAMESGLRDLAVLLDRHAGPNVTISAPAGSVVLAADRADEIDAAVGEALTNVRRHAGLEASAWVLLEREGDEIVISIRDNGIGGTSDEFDGAFRRGRLGMKHSIRGRLHDLGGEATLRTAPGRGVEWEFRVPAE